MKKVAYFFIFFTLGALLMSIFVTADSALSAREIYDGVLRLHVLANSDSDDDQKLKLSVRDAVIGYFEDFGNIETLEEAKDFVDINKEKIIECAKGVVEESGYNYDVKLSLEKEYYPTREYEGVRLPAGTYLSLKIEIGEALGKNWWCVLYPPLCVGSADVDEELSEAGFSTNQIRLITDNEDKGYSIKFRIVESISSFTNKLKKLFR